MASFPNPSSDIRTDQTDNYGSVALCPACGQPIGAPPPQPALEKMLPAVRLQTGHRKRLEALARSHLDRQPSTARFLLEEVNRATLHSELPEPVVAPNTRVLFRLDGEERAHSRTLVYPENYLPTGQYLSVLSPLGAALIGVGEGDRMPFADRQGRRSGVTVVQIAYRPDAFGSAACRAA